MLNKGQEHECFIKADAVDKLYNSQIFNPIVNALRIWKNYELQFTAEVFERTIKEFESNVEKNVVEEAESIIGDKPIKSGFSVPGNLIKQVTIARINYKGLDIFPEGNDLKEKYLEYIKINDTIDDNEPEELPVLQLFSDEVLYELNPSQYYYQNEIIAQLFTGSIWNNFIENELCFYLDPCREYDEDIDKESLYDFKPWCKNEWYTVFDPISYDFVYLYIDAILYFNNAPPLIERIVSLSFKDGLRDVINYKLRGFHGGINYCPLGMLEHIDGLSFPFSVKDNLNKAVELIEKQEIFEMKRAVAQAFINKFKERGLMDEYHTFNDLYSNLINIGRKIDDSACNNTRNMKEIKRDIKRLISFQKHPDFYNNLPPDYKKRYDNILKDMHCIPIPVNPLNEEDAKSQYIGLISELGQFIGNILTTIFKPESTPNEKDAITIGNMYVGDNKRILEKKLTPRDRETCKKFSDDYGKLYNNARKNPDKVKVIINNDKPCHPNELTVNFIKIRKFIKDSHDLLETILKYQNERL